MKAHALVPLPLQSSFISLDIVLPILSIKFLDKANFINSINFELNLSLILVVFIICALILGFLALSLFSESEGKKKPPVELPGKKGYKSDSDTLPEYKIDYEPKKIPGKDNVDLVCEIIPSKVNRSFLYSSSHNSIIPLVSQSFEEYNANLASYNNKLGLELDTRTTFKKNEGSSTLALGDNPVFRYHLILNPSVTYTTNKGYLHTTPEGYLVNSPSSNNRIF